MVQHIPLLLPFNVPPWPAAISARLAPAPVVALSFPQLQSESSTVSAGSALLGWDAHAYGPAWEAY